MYFSTEPQHISLLRDSMRRFSDRHLPRENVRMWDRAGEAPIEVFHELAKTGVCGQLIRKQASLVWLRVPAKPLTLMHWPC